MTLDSRRTESPPASIVAVYGAKRGVGTTIAACNLAVALSQRPGGSVALVDADFTFGGVRAVLGFAPEAAAAGLARHASGVLVAAEYQSWPAGRSDEATVRAIDRLLDDACDHARLVVVDTPSPLTPATVRVLERSQLILLILLPEETVLQHSRAFLDYCERRGLLDRVRVVVNRSDSRSGGVGERLDAEFGPRLVGRLNSGGVLVASSINAGLPFVEAHPTHPLTEQLRGLAHAASDLLTPS